MSREAREIWSIVLIKEVGLSSCIRSALS